MGIKPARARESPDPDGCGTFRFHPSIPIPLGFLRVRLRERHILCGVLQVCRAGESQPHWAWDGVAWQESPRLNGSGAFARAGMRHRARRVRFWYSGGLWADNAYPKKARKVAGGDLWHGALMGKLAPMVQYAGGHQMFRTKARLFIILQVGHYIGRGCLEAILKSFPFAIASGNLWSGI